MQKYLTFGVAFYQQFVNFLLFYDNIYLYIQIMQVIAKMCPQLSVLDFRHIESGMCPVVN